MSGIWAMHLNSVLASSVFQKRYRNAVSFTKSHITVEIMLYK